MIDDSLIPAATWPYSASGAWQSSARADETEFF